MFKKTITVSTEIVAPIEKVWDFWTNPKHIVNWNFASDDWCCPKAENDLKLWWKFTSTMSAKDWSNSFDFSWTYTLIELLKHIKYVIASMYYKDWTLEYNLESGRKVEVIFEKLWDKIKVSEIFEMEDIHTEEQQREGWQAILENFKKYVENN